jgi:hypothetical protein
MSRRPSRSTVRTVAANAAASLAIELAIASLIARLRRGRASATPRRRLVGSVAAALLTEMLETGVSELRWQARRLEAAVEHRAAVESVLPRQRAGGVGTTAESASTTPN